MIRNKKSKFETINSITRKLGKEIAKDYTDQIIKEEKLIENSPKRLNNIFFFILRNTDTKEHLTEIVKMVLQNKETPNFAILVEKLLKLPREDLDLDILKPIFDERFQQIQQKLNQMEPPVKYVIPYHKSRPDINDFLNSSQKEATFSGFANVKEARNFFNHVNVISKVKGAGKNCTLTLTKLIDNDKLSFYNKEIELLKSILDKIAKILKKRAPEPVIENTPKRIKINLVEDEDDSLELVTNKKNF